MKKLFKIILFIIPLSAILMIFCACASNNSGDRGTTFLLQYRASTGGALRDDEDPNLREFKSQLISKGEDAEEITAVPNAGYYFVKWSDGVETAIRQDKNISKSIAVIAEFAEIDDPIQVKYSALGSGYIRCADLNIVAVQELNQTVQNGQSGWTVQADVPGGNNGGLQFIKWSDGVDSAIRQDKNISQSFEVVAEFGYAVKYSSSENGSIVGNANQILLWGDTAESVTAVPNKGYRFVKWSDGVKTATRQDKYISKAIDVYAVFEWRDTDIFTYHYNYATGNYGDDGLMLTRGEVEGKSAIVPERDYFTFDGWYLDEQFKNKAVDATGRNLLGEEIFNSPSRDLYAKWTVKDEYVVTYKILMVYVTAVDGTFVGNDGQNVYVHYRMSEYEKLQCIALTKRFKETLNDMLDGLVNFEVHSFFTTQSLDEHCFQNKKDDTCIYANQIPELINGSILDEYRSVLTHFSFGGEDNLSVNWAGSAESKYATIPLDKYEILTESAEQAFKYFDGIIGTCVHEFCHTVEFGIIAYEFHRACTPCIPSYISFKLYLLNQFPVDYRNILAGDPKLWTEENLKAAWRSSDKAGVPYGYWTNEIFTVTIERKCINGQVESYGGDRIMDGGSVDCFGDGWGRIYYGSKYVQRVPKGSRTTILVARPDKGCKFIGWSDGVQDILRVITDVQENITLIAYFERLSYTVEYIAGEGGRIEGETVQTLLVGERTKAVTVVADEGYRFVGWSDGWGDYPLFRSDHIGQNAYDENGDPYYRLGFTVTAIFEKIDDE